MSPLQPASGATSRWLVGALAVLTPPIWLMAVSGTRAIDVGVLPALLGPSLVSALFWTKIAAWLTRDRQKGVGTALAVGIISPLVCLPLCVAIAPLLLPIDAIFQSFGASAWMGFYGFVFLVREPLLFFPVGMGMGLLVWSIVRFLRQHPDRERSTPAVA